MFVAHLQPHAKSFGAQKLPWQVIAALQVPLPSCTLPHIARKPHTAASRHFLASASSVHARTAGLALQSAMQVRIASPHVRAATQVAVQCSSSETPDSAGAVGVVRVVVGLFDPVVDPVGDPFDPVGVVVDPLGVVGVLLPAYGSSGRVLGLVPAVGRGVLGMVGAVVPVVPVDGGVLLGGAVGGVALPVGGAVVGGGAFADGFAATTFEPGLAGGVVWVERVSTIASTIATVPTVPTIAITSGVLERAGRAAVDACVPLVGYGGVPPV